MTRTRTTLLAVGLVLTSAPAGSAQNTFTVTAITDANPFGLGVGSGNSGDLRYCIDQANALNLSGQPITINFGLAANSTITLGNNILPPPEPRPQRPARGEYQQPVDRRFDGVQSDDRRGQ